MSYWCVTQCRQFLYWSSCYYVCSCKKCVWRGCGRHTFPSSSHSSPCEKCKTHLIRLVSTTNNQLILTTHSFTVDVSTMWDRAERPQRNLDCSGWQSESFSHRVINRPTSTHHCLRFTSQHSHKKPSRTQKSHHFTGESGSIHHTGAANKVLEEKKTPTSAPLRRDLTDIRAAVTSHSHTFRCRVCSCAVLFHI